MTNNPKTDDAQRPTKDNSRVFKFGKFYSKTRLDELPQFYNVSKGDMSFIGPRPELPELVKELAEKFHFMKLGMS